jgi:hypothetical protein
VLYNLHILDVNERTMLRLDGVPSARGNAPVGFCLESYAIVVTDPDDQTLVAELTIGGGGDLYFSVTPANSTLNEDGTRDPLRLCVSRAGLPTGQQTMNMRMVDMQDRDKSTPVQVIAVIVYSSLVTCV